MKSWLGEYLAKEFAALLKHKHVESAVEGNMRGDNGRIRLIRKRIAEIIGLVRAHQISTHAQSPRSQ